MNVDKSIRILQEVCCEDYNKLTKEEKVKLAQEFLDIDEKERPIKYRNIKSVEELLKIFDGLNYKLCAAIKKDLSLKKYPAIIADSNDNKIGADAFFYDDNNNKIFLEMKFGHETLANIGNSTMNNLFNLDNEEKNFLSIAKSIKEHQRFLIDSGVEDEEELLKELRTKLEEVAEELKSMNLKPNNSEIKKLISTTGKNNQDMNNLVKYEIFPDEINMKLIYNSNEN